ncbi:MAG: putative peptidoglycan glycosyltransferase FtsW [Hyphomicrobiaceae bacterium]
MRLSRADRSIVSDWWFTIDRQLVAAVYVLLMTGLVLSLAASPAIALRLGLGTYHFVERHVVFLALAALLMLLTSLLQPGQIRRVSFVLLVAMALLMVLVLAFGPEVNGARRWIGVLGQRLQPSELMKPAFVVVSAWLFAEEPRRPDMPVLSLAVGLYLLMAALLVLEPDIGQTLLVTLVWGGLFFLSGQPLKRVFGLVAVAGLALVAAYLGLGHVRSRFDRFVNPDSGDTYQMDRARQSFIEGGWFGRGPGEGTIKTLLPDAHTDYILAVVAEEYGVLTCLVLVALFGFIVFRAIFRIAAEPAGFTRNAVYGLVMLFAFQALINMGVNVGLLPAKGMTLPFISYGGSSLIGMALTMGLLIGLTRRHARSLRPRNATFLGSDEIEDAAGAKGGLAAATINRGKG